MPEERKLGGTTRTCDEAGEADRDLVDLLGDLVLLALDAHARLLDLCL